MQSNCVLGWSFSRRVQVKGGVCTVVRHCWRERSRIVCHPMKRLPSFPLNSGQRKALEGRARRSPLTDDVNLAAVEWELGDRLDNFDCASVCETPSAIQLRSAISRWKCWILVYFPSSNFHLCRGHVLKKKMALRCSAVCQIPKHGKLDFAWLYPLCLWKKILLNI